MTVRATPWMPERRRWTFTLTPFRVVLIGIVAVFAVLVAYRLIYGIGAPTNLTDRWPWAIWTWWKLAGVALAGAGYGTAWAIHFFGRERWHDIERGAFVLSLLGYLMVCSALILDLGQWYNAWHPIVHPNVHSVMFELFWCIGLYTVVQCVEFFYIFEERIPNRLLHVVLKRIYGPLMLFGALLPVFHQSALCSLYVLAKGRLDPMWWSMLLPLFAVLTSLYVGSSVILMENFAAERTYGRPVHLRIIGRMVRVSATLMALYLALRLGDYAVRGVLDELFSGTMTGNVAAIELGFGVFLPMVMFMTPSVRTSRVAMFIAAGLTIAGVVGYRYNIVITGMQASIGEGFYRPSWMEVWFMLGMGACVLLAYLFIVENFPVYTKVDVAASVAARSEQEAERRARELPTVRSAGVRTGRPAPVAASPLGNDGSGTMGAGTRATRPDAERISIAARAIEVRDVLHGGRARPARSKG